MRFVLSRRAINDLAKAVEAGEYPEVPCRAGLFLIRHIEAQPGRSIKLWTGGLGPGSAGRFGLARGVARDAPRYWWQVQLDNDWWYVVED